MQKESVYWHKDSHNEHECVSRTKFKFLILAATKWRHFYLFKKSIVLSKYKMSFNKNN